MALTQNNFIGFESGGLDESTSLVGSPVVQSAVVRTGKYALKLPSGSLTEYRTPSFLNPSDAGNNYIVGFAVQFSDVTPAANLDFFETSIASISEQISLVLTTGGNLELREHNETVSGTATTPFTVDTWHYIELYWKKDHTTGEAEVFVDGVSVIGPVTDADFDTETGAATLLIFRNPAASLTDVYFDDIYVLSGATAASDRLNKGSGVQVLGYKHGQTGVAPDGGSGGTAGVDLDNGAWPDTQDGSDGTNGEYTGSGDRGTVDWLGPAARGIQPDPGLNWLDTSDAGPTDNEGNWNGDANAFDGDDATEANTVNTGSETNNELRGEGTSFPTGAGDDFDDVRVRFVIDHSATGITTKVRIYADGGTELLFDGSITGFSTKVTTGALLLTVPSGGWTRAKLQGLESVIWFDAGIGTVRMFLMELTTEVAVANDADIVATKAHFRLDRDGGAGSTHVIALSDSGDGNNATEFDDNNDWGPITQTPGWHAVLQTLAAKLPSTTENIRAGFGTLGAQDIHMYDGWVFLLHVPPSAVSNDISATSGEVFGQTADINAPGEMGASSSMLYGETPNINAPGALDATSIEAFADAGADLQGIANEDIAATSTLNFDKLNADLRAIGLLSATSVEDFSEVPDINAPGQLAASGELIVETYALANHTIDEVLTSAQFGVSQSFNGVQGVLKSVEFYLHKDGTPPGSMRAHLRAHSGTFGTSSIPTGPVLALSADIVANSISTSKALIRFEFSDGFEMQSGTDYCILLNYEDGGFVANRIHAGIDDTSPTHAGNEAHSNVNDVWTAESGEDLIFVLRTDVGVAFGANANINAPTDITSTSPLTYGEANATLNALGELTITATLVYSENPDINAPGTMAATSTALFDDSGADLQAGGIKDMTSTSPETFGANADINAPGNMTIDASLVYGEAADINAPANMAASASEVFAATPVINAPGEMAATSALVYGELNATLNALGELTITATLVYGEANATLNAPANMAATSTALFDDAGADLQGVADNEITATSPETFGAAADLDAIAELLSTSVLAYSEAPDINALTDIAATSPLVYGELTVDLDAVGELSITATLVYSETPSINAPANMSADSSLLYAATAVLNALGELTITATLVFDDAGADLQGASNEDMTATSAEAFAAAADINAIGEVAASSSEVYAATAVLNAIGEMLATSVLAFSEAGADLDAIAEMLATSPISFDKLTAALTAIAEIRSTSPLAYTEVADISAIGEMTAVAVVTFSESGADLSIRPADMTALSGLTFAQVAALDAVGAIGATSLVVFSESPTLDSQIAPPFVIGVFGGDVEVPIVIDVVVTSINEIVTGN